MRFLKNRRIPPRNSPGGFFKVLESFTGAWQQNVVVEDKDITSYSPVFSCMTLISGDIAKLEIIKRNINRSGIWAQAENDPIAKVLDKPNGFQTRTQFVENWFLSKLGHGNTYVLLARDDRGRVDGLYVLDPELVTVRVTPSGAVYYQLNADNLAGIETNILVPASEIIHDRYNCLVHPLVGMSPIMACSLPAIQGIRIQRMAANFFRNGAVTPGILSTDLSISEESATKLKEQWEENYSGPSARGKIAVLGDGLKYSSMAMSSVDAQLIEQLKYTAEVIAACFHVPPYMIGVGAMPNYNNVQVLNQQYYSQALQFLIESMELCLDHAFDLDRTKSRTYVDVKGLLRMDTMTQVEVTKTQISAGLLTPNEGRAEFNRDPLKGGETAYLQVQNWGLEALSKRDSDFIEGVESADSSAVPVAVESSEEKFISQLRLKFEGAAYGGAR